MKIKTLHKILAGLIADGHGHKTVCIDKGTFNHPLEEDGVVILDVKKAAMKEYEIRNDDGGDLVLKSGWLATRLSLVIEGSDNPLSPPA